MVDLLTEPDRLEIEARVEKAKVVSATVREAIQDNDLTELHIEARFSDGQKFAVASVDEEHEAVAFLFANAAQDLLRLSASDREREGMVKEALHTLQSAPQSPHVDHAKAILASALASARKEEGTP